VVTPGFTPVVPQKPTSENPVNTPATNIVPTEKAAPPTVVYPLSRARLILPDKSEVGLPREETTFGRSDFEKALSSVASPYVSRQHFKIKADNGKYYILDNNSANGTRLNGIDIRGIGWQEIRNDDRIDIAEMVALTFKTDNPIS